jgi:carbamoyltransferase
MFFAAAGCPMLLNTSLNIKGEPLVDTWDDVMRFRDKTGFRVF